MNDKLLHFLVCILIAAVSMTVFAVTGWPLYGFDAGLTAVIVGAVAASKELIWDKWLHKGTPDYYDFFWGVVGGWSLIFAWKTVATIFGFI